MFSAKLCRCITRPLHKDMDLRTGAKLGRAHIRPHGRDGCSYILRIIYSKYRCLSRYLLLLSDSSTTAVVIKASSKTVVMRPTITWHSPFCCLCVACRVITFTLLRRVTHLRALSCALASCGHSVGERGVEAKRQGAERSSENRRMHTKRDSPERRAYRVQAALKVARGQ